MLKGGGGQPLTQRRQRAAAKNTQCLKASETKKEQATLLSPSLPTYVRLLSSPHLSLRPCEPWWVSGFSSTRCTSAACASLCPSAAHKKKSRVITHFDQWISRTFNQISMTKLKSRYKHEHFRKCYVLRAYAGLYFERLSSENILIISNSA